MNDPNPYMAPGTGPPKPPKNFRWTALRIWLAILLLPAACIAFCTTCTATTLTVYSVAESGPWPNQPSVPIGLVVGTIAGVAVLAGMIWQIRRVSR
jgi:hypothetical protein